MMKMEAPSPQHVRRRSVMVNADVNNIPSPAAARLNRYAEQPMSISQFLWEGMSLQLLLPVLLPLLGLKHQRVKCFLLPMGTVFFFSPFLWLLAAATVTAAVLLISNPDWSKDVYLRQSGPGVQLVGVGEAAFALSLYLIGVVIASISTSHQPLREEGREMLPFSKSLQVTTRMAQVTSMTSVNPLEPKSPTNSPPLSPTQKLLLKEAATGSSSTSQHATTVHIPYDHVLLDEIPPIADDVTLLYQCDVFFEPNRDFEYTLYEEEDRVTNGMEDSIVSEGSTSINLQPHSGFKFAIGEILRRSSVEPNHIFDFGGDVGIACEDTVVEVASRRWGADGEQLYTVDGAGEGRWFNLNEHFVRCSGRIRGTFLVNVTPSGAAAF